MKSLQTWMVHLTGRPEDQPDRTGNKISNLRYCGVFHVHTSYNYVVYAPVTQWIECCLRKTDYEGSKPFGGYTFWHLILTDIWVILSVAKTVRTEIL